MRVLDGVLTWTKDGINYEADPRHAEIAIDELRSNDAKGVVPPRAKDESTTQEGHDDKLDDVNTHHWGR